MRPIDADALMERMYIGDDYWARGVLIKEQINTAPTIDVAPVVHARWTGGKYYNDVYGYEKTCTACQKEYVVGFDYLYCPYCGARMDGEPK